MSLILNIETSIDVCSVALFDESTLVDYRENSVEKTHASLLTVFINDLLNSNKVEISQLSAIAVSMGPGSYTGLRIGVSVAKGMCYGASIPLISVNTLQIMVKAFLQEKNRIKEPIPANSILIPMIDARHQEVYSAFYNVDGKEIAETRAVIINELTFMDEPAERRMFFFGNGAEKCNEIIKHPNAVFTTGIYPLAINMGEFSWMHYKLGNFQDTAYFEPYYLKDFVATVPKNKVLPLG